MFPELRQFLVKDLTAAFIPQQGDPMFTTASLHKLQYQGTDLIREIGQLDSNKPI